DQDDHSHVQDLHDQLDRRVIARDADHGNHHVDCPLDVGYHRILHFIAMRSFCSTYAGSSWNGKINSCVACRLFWPGGVAVWNRCGLRQAAAAKASVDTDPGHLYMRRIDICLLSFGYRAICTAPERSSLSKIGIPGRNALSRCGRQHML